MRRGESVSSIDESYFRLGAPEEARLDKVQVLMGIPLENEGKVCFSFAHLVGFAVNERETVQVFFERVMGLKKDFVIQFKSLNTGKILNFDSPLGEGAALSYANFLISIDCLPDGSKKIERERISLSLQENQAAQEMKEWNRLVSECERVCKLAEDGMAILNRRITFAQKSDRCTISPRRFVSPSSAVVPQAQQTVIPEKRKAVSEDALPNIFTE